MKLFITDFYVILFLSLLSFSSIINLQYNKRNNLKPHSKLEKQIIYFSNFQKEEFIVSKFNSNTTFDNHDKDYNNKFTQFKKLNNSYFINFKHSKNENKKELDYVLKKEKEINIYLNEITNSHLNRTQNLNENNQSNITNQESKYHNSNEKSKKLIKIKTNPNSNNNTNISINSHEENYYKKEYEYYDLSRYHYFIFQKRCNINRCNIPRGKCLIEEKSQKICKCLPGYLNLNLPTRDGIICNYKQKYQLNAFIYELVFLFGGNIYLGFYLYAFLKGFVYFNIFLCAYLKLPCKLCRFENMLKSKSNLCCCNIYTFMIIIFFGVFCWQMVDLLNITTNDNKDAYNMPILDYL